MLALAAAAILLIAGRALAGIYADYLWYDSQGAVALWRTRLVAVATLRGGSMVAASLFAFANLYAVRQSVVSLVFPRRVGNIEIGEEVPGRYLIAIAAGLALVLGALLSLSAQNWTSAVLAVSGKRFGETDPYFDSDLGFFVYRLPFENALWTWAFLVVIVVIVTVIALYALTPSLKWQRGGSIYASTYVRRHLTVLVGILLAMLAWSFRLDMYALLLDGSGVEGAFGYVDYRVGIPGNLILALTTLAAALIVLWAGFVGQLRLAGISVLTVIGLSLAIREAAPAIIEHSGTDAARNRRELPYLGTRATFTRRAFAVDAVLRADSTVAFPSLAAALPWVSVWDPPALARAIDGGRAGDVAKVKIGWRTAPAGLLADVVDPPPPGASSRAPWTLARVLGAVADDRGTPLRMSGPSASAIDDTPLEAPLVYPGAPPYTVIADSLTRSTGTSLEPVLSRIANAWSLQNFRILSTDSAQPHPTIISHRSVRDRLTLLAPFFAQGRQIEPLLVGDSLYWAVDLYAVSSTYPLSRHISFAGDDCTYLRHAAVAVVQASTGETSIVPDSSLDPIAWTWVHRLPSVFASWSALPPGLSALLAPPIDGLGAQANAFGRYGSQGDTDPPRHVPTLDGSDTSLVTDPVPIVLPDGKRMALTMPLVDETDRLRGLLIGTGGSSPRVLWYPLTSPGPRWSPVLDRLRSVDTAGTAAREGTLAPGRVRTVPIRGGIGFVQPKYRWRPQTVPTLSRVALLSGDTALSILPNATMPSRGEVPVAAGDMKATVSALYSAMRAALQRGDWVAFGRAFDALGKTVGRGPGTENPP
jgi:Uncharacterized conserved protein